MKLYKKINNYLLENHPLIWSSRLFPMLLTAILFWAFSFLTGFATMNEGKLIQFRFFQNYFSSFYVSFHIIFVLVVIIIWAINFYKHNAFKRLYPLEKGYFIKLFFYLFVPIFLLISVYHPFTLGSKLRTASLMNKKELMADRDILNLARPFMPMSADEYKIENRVYPSPFPLKTIKYDQNTNKWNSNYYKIPASYDDKTNKLLSVYDYRPDEGKTTLVDGRAFQFLRTENEEIGNEGCRTSEIVKESIQLDEEKYQLDISSVLNFSRLMIGPDDYPYQVKEKILKQYFSEARVYKNTYAATVHEWVKKKDYASIEKAIRNATAVLNKYHIDHNLEPAKLVKYLRKKKFKNLVSVVSVYREQYEDLDEALDDNYLTKTEYNELPFEEQFEIYSKQYVRVNEMETLFQNLQYSEVPTFFSNFEFSIFYFAFYMAMAFMLFAVLKPLPFLLSIPIWGILNIVCGLLISSLHYNGKTETVVVSIFLFQIILVILINWWFLRDPKISKKPLNVTISMVYCASPLVLPLLSTLLHFVSAKKRMNDCGYEIRHYFLDGALISMPVLFLLGLISFLLFLLLLKPWKAKAE